MQAFKLLAITSYIPRWVVSQSVRQSGQGEAMPTEGGKVKGY